MGRLVILSGPSCVGKGPLAAALGKFFPALSEALQPVVLFNSRQPRPQEVDGVDYHFRSRATIEGLRTNPDYLFMDVRGDLQALALPELRQQLVRGDALFEGNPFVGRSLAGAGLPPELPRLSIFLSPLSRDEILELRGRGVDLAEFVTNVQRFKLLRRTTKQKERLSLKDLENIERRAASAWREMQEAPHFDWVIPNHDGEGHENWDQFYHPIGDARRALLALAALLQGENPVGAEHWERELV